MAESMPTSTVASLAPADLELLKKGIMSEIQSKLSKKEEELWKRGQVEIKRLKEDQIQVKDVIGQLQDNQTSLLTENKELRGALLEVTSRFELVVKEMRQVLRAFPQQRGGSAATTSLDPMQPSPSPSVASTSASEALRDELSPESSYEPTTADKTGTRTTPSTGARSQQSPAVCDNQTAASESRRDAEDRTSATFCTPPRNDAAAQDAGLDAGPATSPAVLSLAKSLPPVSSTPTKRLQLAECLDGAQASKAALPITAPLPAPPSTPAVQQPTDVATATAASPSPARHFDFVNVEIVKESGFVTLGIEVNQVDGVSLCVESIDEHGLVGRHNVRQDARSSSRVQVGDRVIEVNGIRQDPNLMLQECKVRQRLVFTIARDSCRSHSIRKASSGSEDCAPVEDPVAPSPLTTKLRPEASIFVPASQAAQEVSAPPLVLPAVAVVPPGFESFGTSGLLTLPTGPALGTQFASMLEAAAGVGIHCPPPPPLGMPMVSGYDEEEEVKRALFP